MSEIGYNSGINGIAADQLRSYVDRRENLEDAKADIQADIKQLNAEVKALGYDMKIFNELIQRRKKYPTKEARDEHDTTLEIYENVFD